MANFVGANTTIGIVIAIFRTQIVICVLLKFKRDLMLFDYSYCSSS